MTPGGSVCFIVPAHGRTAMTRACLRQLKRTCDELNGYPNVFASAVVIACDENLDTAAELGFATVKQANVLGRKVNDGIELAARHGIDFVVRFGTDDFVDARLIRAQMLSAGDIRCSRKSTVVNESGTLAANLHITYPGGDGVQMVPTELFRGFNYRPVDEDRHRAIDAATMRAVALELGREPSYVYQDIHPLQIVDFKSPSEQLNSYADCTRSFQVGDEFDPWTTLAKVYPAEALEEVAAVYGHTMAVAA